MTRSWRVFRRAFYEVQPRPVYLSVATFVESAPPNLREWLGFHRAAGVERFYIGYPENQADLERTLRADAAASDVTLHAFGEEKAPAAALFEIAKRTRRVSRWLALIGPRDYLFSPAGPNLGAPLRDFEACPAVAVFPYEYPLDEGKEEQSGAPLSTLRLRRPEPGRSYCSIVNPLLLRAVRRDGSVALRKGRLPVNERKRPAEAGTHSGKDAGLFRVNRMDFGQRGLFGKRGVDLWRERRKTAGGLVEDPAWRPEALSKGEGRPRGAPGRATGARLAVWGRAVNHTVRATRLALPRRYYLSLGSMFRNAAPYLVEWIEFHRLVGFEHFYLYNNDSSDDFRNVLKPYCDAGLVTLMDWPAGSGQVGCLEHCARIAARQTRWLALLDDDEFLFPAKGDSLPEALSDYEAFAGVAIPWLVFGASGHRAMPRGLVIENFTWRAEAPDRLHKLVIDPMLVAQVFVPHQVRFRQGYVSVNEKKAPEILSESRSPSAERFRLHHYYTKSYEEAELKVRQRGYPGDFVREDEQQRAFLKAAGGNGFNEVEDRAIQRFVPALRKAVANPARRQEAR